MGRGAEASILTLRALRAGCESTQQIATYRGCRPDTAYQALWALARRREVQVQPDGTYRLTAQGITRLNEHDQRLAQRREGRAA